MSLALAPDTALESALNLRDAPQLDIGPELISHADEGNGRLAERPTVQNKACYLAGKIISPRNCTLTEDSGHVLF